MAIEPTAETPRNRRERKAAETRDRIYRAAIELFAERGFANVTVEQITERADVGKGTFFNYFERKEAVLTLFSAHQVERLHRAMRAGEISGTAREQIEKVMNVLATHPQLTRDLARALFVTALGNVQLAEVEGPQIWHIEELLADMVRQGQADGEFVAGTSPEEVGPFLLGVHFISLLRWCTNFTEQSLPEINAEFLRQALDGLAAWPKPAVGTGAPHVKTGRGRRTPGEAATAAE
jgi:TetR/AcrR family transcriptional regulator, cholesterol catabolism regulator